MLASKGNLLHIIGAGDQVCWAIMLPTRSGSKESSRNRF